MKTDEKMFSFQTRKFRLFDNLFQRITPLTLGGLGADKQPVEIGAIAPP